MVPTTTHAGRLLRSEFWSKSSAEMFKNNIIAANKDEFPGSEPGRFVYITEYAHWIPFVRKYVVHFRYADFLMHYFTSEFAICEKCQ